LCVFLLIVFIYIDLSKICCINIITNPSANSAAEKIKKKNVNDNILTLSNKKPISNTIMYRDIHINSAVSNKCNAVLTFSAMVRKKIKNSTNTRFKSPNTIIFRLLFFLSLYISLRDKNSLLSASQK
jgi:hypothetical protein